MEEALQPLVLWVPPRPTNENEALRLGPSKRHSKGEKRKDPEDSDRENVKEYVLQSSWTIETMLT